MEHATPASERILHIKEKRICLDSSAVLYARPFDPVRFGQLIYAHHVNLRDGLGISTPEIEQILQTAMANGAYGGKVNGSGGGGCCYVYCATEDAEKILQAVEAQGYPGHILKGDKGNCVEA